MYELHKMKEPKSDPKINKTEMSLTLTLPYNNHRFSHFFYLFAASALFWILNWIERNVDNGLSKAETMETYTFTKSEKKQICIECVNRAIK